MKTFSGSGFIKQILLLAIINGLSTLFDARSPIKKVKYQAFWQLTALKALAFFCPSLFLV